MVTIGFGTFSPASRIRIPSPPQNSTTFIEIPFQPSPGRYSDRDPAQVSPAHRRVEPPRVQQLPDFRQSNVSRKHLLREPVPREVLVELLDPTADGPVRAEAWKVPGD